MKLIADFHITAAANTHKTSHGLNRYICYICLLH